MPPDPTPHSEKGALSYRAAFLIEARAIALCGPCLQDYFYIPAGAQNILVVALIIQSIRYFVQFNKPMPLV